MKIKQASVGLDFCAKFFRTVRIAGWVKHPEQSLIQVDVLNCERIAQEFRVGLEHANGAGIGFTVDLFLNKEEFPFGSFVCFSFSDLSQEMVALYDLVYERLAASATFSLYQRFLSTVASPEFPRVLDVGGRSRSGVDRRKSFPNNEVTVFDILPGDNVDVVGDAHELSLHFSGQRFDAIQSASVFEHILMPWKVVIEMNRVLRPNGLVLVHTHQSLGLHDQPCDFWRFSKDCWPALFNERTGFEILEAAVSHGNTPVPHFWRPEQAEAEKTQGFEMSVVLARKISDTKLAWDVTPRDVGAAAYPAGQLPNPFA